MGDSKIPFEINELAERLAADTNEHGSPEKNAEAAAAYRQDFDALMQILLTEPDAVGQSSSAYFDAVEINKIGQMNQDGYDEIAENTPMNQARTLILSSGFTDAGEEKDLLSVLRVVSERERALFERASDQDVDHGELREIAQDYAFAKDVHDLTLMSAGMLESYTPGSTVEELFSRMEGLGNTAGDDWVERAQEILGNPDYADRWDKLTVGEFKLLSKHMDDLATYGFEGSARVKAMTDIIFDPNSSSKDIDRLTHEIAVNEFSLQSRAEKDGNVIPLDEIQGAEELAVLLHNGAGLHEAIKEVRAAVMDDNAISDKEFRAAQEALDLGEQNRQNGLGGKEF